MNIAIRLVPFLFCFAPICYSAGNETLLTVYALAQKHDHQLKSDYAKFLIDSEAVNINRAALLPAITGTAQASRSRTTNQVVSSIHLPSNDVDEHRYGVSLKQNIVDFEAIRHYQKGKVQTALAAITYQSKQQQLIIRCAQAYFDALRALDQQRTAKAEEDAQMALLKQTRQRFSVGIIPINDVHEAKAAYDDATANTINANAIVNLKLDELGVLTGRQHTGITPLQANFNPQSPDPDTQQSWVDFALSNNLELQANKLAVDIARLDTQMTKAAHFPKLQGSVNYGSSSSTIDDKSATPTDNQSDEVVFGLQLTIPLYQGGELLTKKRQAAQNSILAQEQYLLSKRNTIQKARSLYSTVTTNIAQIKARKQAVLSNTSAFESSKAGYDAGIRDAVDIVNANRNVFQAQRNYLDAIYEYIINTLLLKQAAGNLHTDDLAVLEQSLAVSKQ